MRSAARSAPTPDPDSTFDPDRHALGFDDISRRFADGTEVRLGSLQVTRGTLTAVLGRSGCGKSTLLSLLGATDRLGRGDTGRLHFAPTPRQCWSWGPGEPAPTAVIRRSAGLVFQDDALLSSLSVCDNVILPRIVLGSRLESAGAHDALASMGLGGLARRNPLDLSGGERARVALLRARSHDPLVLLCDEPTSELDPSTASRLMHDLASWVHGAPNRTALAVTHDVAAAFHWADEIAVWDGSGFVRVGRHGSHWPADAWTTATRALDCAWLSGPPTRPSTHRVPVAPRPIQLSGRPTLQAMALLAFRDFWSYPRSSGRWLGRRAHPLLLLAASVLLYATLLFSTGLQQGIDARIQADRADPAFRFTTIQVPRRSRPETHAALAPLGDLEHAAFERLVVDFVHPDRARRVPAMGVALHPSGDLYRSMLHDLEHADPIELARLASMAEPDRYDGVILSAALCDTLGARDVRLALPVSNTDPKTGRVAPSFRHVAVPVLGCTADLPQADFVATLGFARAEAGCHPCALDASELTIPWRGGPDLAGTGAALRAALAAEVSAEHPGHTVEPSIRIDGPVYSGDLEGPAITVVLRDEASRPLPISREGARAAARRAGLDGDVRFDAEGYPGATAHWAPDRFMVPLPPTMDVDAFRAMVANARPHGIAVDGAVVGRLKALERLGTTLSGFNRYAAASLAALLLGFCVVIAGMDAAAKVRAHSVLSAMGLRRRHYLDLVSGQALVVQLLALSLALLAHASVLPFLTRHVLGPAIGLELHYGLAPAVGPVAAMLGVQLLLAIGLRRAITTRSSRIAHALR